MQITEAVIEKLSHEGRGITHIDGKATFVFGALAGERVRFRYTRRRGRYDEAEVVEVLEPAAERTEPACPHFSACGGCSLQHVSNGAQLAHKQTVMLEQLQHAVGIAPETVLPPLHGPQFGYRRKARLSARYVVKKGRLVLGFRERNGRYVADLDSCPVLDPAVGSKLQELRAVLDALSVRDQIPQIEVACGDEADVLVVRHLKALSDSDRNSLRDFEQRSGLRCYCQPNGPDSIHPLSEAVELNYKIAMQGGRDLKVTFSPSNFTQVNFAINHGMIEQVLSVLEPDAGDSVLDLFCGLGNFSLPLATRAARLTGVEGDAGLVARADQNALLNGITNVDFRAADLSSADVIDGLNTSGFDRVLLDPPRTGAAAVVKLLRLDSVQRLVYVSCNPATLARDAAVLVKERGLILRSAGIMDMFPHTAHVESLAMFEPRS
jgi:23S rRNA (uracil1939-C5)-methyltransferase